jgi:hypothetical protein
MKSSQTLILFLIFPIIFSQTFNTVLENLKTLEGYIAEYKTEKQSSESLNHLILAFIRQGKYDDMQWTIAAGSVPSDLYDYVKNKDETHGTNTLMCRKYGDIVLPTKKKIDFVHLFAVMNGMDYLPLASALVGWGGDLAQLAQDLKKNFPTLTDLDQLIVEARKFLGIKGQFGEGDLNADIDAPIILKRKKSSITFSDTIRTFYENGDYKYKIRDFVNIIFPDLKDKTKIREYLEANYTDQAFIQILECKYGLRTGSFKCYLPGDIVPEFANHRKAAIYAFADFLGENI